MIQQDILQAAKKGRAHQANYKTFDIKSVVPANYARTMVAQALWR